jgi:hypothetical protein
MAFIGRGSLPSNYVDFAREASMPFMLPTPTPQFVFAQWAMAGRVSLAALDAGAETAQQFVTMSAGGAPVAQELDRLARVADMYPGFVQAVDIWGENAGDTVKFQRPIYSAGGLTEASRELVGNSAISTTGRSIKMEEVPVVLKEFHGPYASDGSSVQPYEIKSFDARYRANKLKLTGLVNKHLLYDYTYWLDTVIRDRFRASTYATLSNPDFSDVTSYVAGGGSTFTAEQWLRARKTLSDREWQRFDNGRYVGLVPTAFNTQMLQDVEYRDLSKNHQDGRNQIYGYIGSLQDIDFFECSTLKSYAAASTVPGTGGGTVPSGVALAEGILVGPGAVGFGTGPAEYVPGDMLTMNRGPVVRFADDTNYGTLAKVIWYALHAFQTLDERGVQRVIAQTT